MSGRNGMRGVAVGTAMCLALAAAQSPASASKKGDAVAAGVAGAVIGGLIGAAAANSAKYKPAPAYPPPYQPGYQPGYVPAPYPVASPVDICMGYGNKYSQKSGALGVRLDSIVSVRPTGYNQTVVAAYMTVLWAGYQKTAYVTCTVTNGNVTSWRVA